MADNSPGLLARLFKRKPTSNLLGELHSRAINRPLFINSDLGAQVLRGYLSEPQAYARIDGEYQGATTKQGEIAVIDISGPLVSRAVVGPSGTGPLSYEDIRAEFDEALADEEIAVIVLRLDSPGGEAAQMTDLSDHIYHLRGLKPIIAMVDDAAYSAAYGIATAADEIWITRTGGVGSVGVVAYHLDQSAMNSRQGIKIEYIHAGARKVDFNPHQSLSTAARARMQSEIDRLYELFTRTVARNLGMEIEAVKATEAATYHGEQALEIGFAHRLGTFNDLLAYLDNGDAYKPSVKPSIVETQNTRAEHESNACDESQADKPVEQPDAPEQPDEPAAPADSTDLPKNDTQSALSEAQQAEIRAVCKAAGLADVADDYIQAGTRPDQVRADLMALLTTGDIEIESAQRVAVSSKQDTDLNQAVDVYTRRKQHTLNHR